MLERDSSSDRENEHKREEDRDGQQSELANS
jgi:hypothetical protein